MTEHLRYYWHRIVCWITGNCVTTYEPHRDPLVRRFARLEAATEYEARRLRPRDLIDPREEDWR